MATNPVDLMGALNAYRQSIQGQRERLMQPAPQQGGFLSGSDPVMLSLAAGLLSPTKTGGFGESVASGLSAAAGPLSDIRKQEEARLDKLGALSSAEAKLAMDMYELQTGGRGRNYKPDEPNLVYQRYLDNRAAVDAQLQDAISSKDQASIDKWTKELEKLDKKAATIFGDTEQKSGLDKPDPLANVEYEGPYPKIQNEQQYNALPSGTVYIHPKTGKPKTKP